MLALAVAAPTCLAGCQRPVSRTETDPDTEADAGELLSKRLELEIDGLVSTVETLRDRSFQSPPTWRAEEGPLDPPPRSYPDPIAGEARFLGRILFDLDGGDPVPPSDEIAHLAYYDREGDRIVFRKDADSRSTLEMAVVAALIEALDARHFDPIPAADTLDGHLARAATESADAYLAAAAHLADDEREVSETLATLARQPGRALSLEPLGGHLRREPTDSRGAVDSHSELASRLATFLRREGLGVGSAFYRSNGWSGVELLRSFHPASTADVVRPDRWMQGRALGEWRWPEQSPLADTDELDRSGRVGPALVAAWLSQAFRPDLARTVYSGWRSDAYRYRTFGSDDDEPAWRFEWMTQWDSPSSTRQVAAGFEKLLGELYETTGDEETTYGVVRKGLQVGVVLESAAQPADGEWPEEATYLSEARVQFQPREPLPTSFRPTRTDEFRQKASEARIEQNAWRDPASNLAVDLSAVADWKTRRSRTLPLRWFAKRQDYVLQMTTEVADPFGPEFGSEAYVADLEEAFTASLADASFDSKGTRDTPRPGSLRFGVTGQRDEQAWRLEAWHLRHGDVLATISLQGPADSFDSRLETARSVVETVETTGDAPGPGGDSTGESNDGGSIEYEIEDEEP